MKKFYKILKWIAYILGGIFIITMFFPSTARVERSIAIKAPASVVFDQVGVLKNWPAWSPWHKIDTAMKLTYEGPASGVGAKYSWESKNDKVGSGSMTTTTYTKNDIIIFEMTGMGGESTTTFKFGITDTAVNVTWNIETKLGYNPISRIIGLFFDKMVGPDFENGLNNLKVVCEKMPKNAIDVLQTSVQEQAYLSIRETVTPENISERMGAIYGEIMAYMSTCGLKAEGSPFAIYHTFSEKSFDMEAGIPVNKTGKSKGRIIAGTIKKGNAVMAKYYGKYQGTGLGHAKIDEFIKANKLTVIGAPWEVYVTDPGIEKDTAKWLTEIYYPVK
ncbi:MAG: SRPBCC family protein [Bacteroidota bacterium]